MLMLCVDNYTTMDVSSHEGCRYRPIINDNFF